MRRMKFWGVYVAGLLLLPAMSAIAGEVPSSQQAGMSMYRDGLLPSGAPLRGVLRNGAELAGADAACARCHRRSGLGSGEGQKVVRPIAGKLLFECPAELLAEKHQRNAQVHTALECSPYSEESFARALRDGVDPAGRILDELMPHFAMSDAEIAQLAAYLKNLSRQDAAGVDENAIHFATVVTPGVAPARSAAMLEVLQEFFAVKNAGTRKEKLRKGIARERMYTSYRRWELHVWKLEGPPATWPAQLESNFRKQPVFAMLSGIGADNWQPVHDFCEQSALPCLFPNIDYPVQAENHYASIYFSRGVVLEAEVLASHLLQSGQAAGAIVQLFRDNAAGRKPAQALRAAMRQGGSGDMSERPLAAGESLSAADLHRLLAEKRPQVLVLWLDDADIADFPLQEAMHYGVERIYLSGSLLHKPGQLPEGSREKLRLVYPFELTRQGTPGLLRMKHWLKSRHIALRDERIQAGAYFAASIAGDALALMESNFSRDYLIERVEQMTENVLSSALYPRLSLGAGQRYASRGSYLARFASGGERQLEPASPWIVP